MPYGTGFLNLEKMKIHIEFEFEGVPGLAQDDRGSIWRMPFKSANNCQFAAKQLEPTYDRNYTAYRHQNKRYSEKRLELLRVPVNYTIEV